MDTVTQKVVLWRWTGASNGSWHFVTFIGEAAESLSATRVMRRLESGRATGFGSMRVMATIGDTTWQTSVFPEKDGGWILPVKVSVRKAEGLAEGDSVDCRLQF